MCVTGFSVTDDCDTFNSDAWRFFVILTTSGFMFMAMKGRPNLYFFCA